MIVVLGLGNVLMGDDGFGPAAIRAFEQTFIAGPDVTVVDVGTPGLDLTPWLADIDAAIIVDTVKADLPPGSLRVYNKASILKHAPTARVGPHDPGAKEALLMLEFAGRAPRDVALIGVVPAQTELGLDLSPQVADVVPGAAEAISLALEHFGSRTIRRMTPASVAPWWQSGRVPQSHV